MTARPLSELQDVIGFTFQQEALLVEALTHRSYLNEVGSAMLDNERLEFLGDAVLEFAITDTVFRRFDEANEGELTQLRSALVRTESLAMLARELDLGAYLLIGKGEEANGGRERMTLLCRAYEALVGAVYMDAGIERVKQVFMPAFERLLADILAQSSHKDARSLLQERSQAELRVTPTYRVVEVTGPEHEREYTSEVLIGEVVIGQGTGKSKRIAAQTSARNALMLVEASGWSAAALAYAESQLASDEAP